MRLIRYRVTNYRSVDDSGWIDADRVTALVGVNESGKTNLLLPLWKLNPAGDEGIRPTSDYPKANYNAVKANPKAFRFICAEFDSSAITDELASLTDRAPTELELVQVSRDLSGAYSLTFPVCPVHREADRQVVTDIVDNTSAELANIPALAKEGTLKSHMLSALSAERKMMSGQSAITANVVEGVLARSRAILPASTAPTSSIVPRYNGYLQEIEQIERALKVTPPEQVAGVVDLVLRRLPKFVFYSNYGNLDSEIYLPHVVENMSRTDLGAKEAAKARTLRVLFDFVKLQPKEVLALGRDYQNPQGRRPTDDEIAAIATQKRERTILLNSAGTDLTKKFSAWWKQGDYTFEFQADGDHFRIWVSDGRRPEKVELEDRSTGLQWFFSFYLVFLVESQGAHQDAILLLDEPGLSLHPLAQRDLSAFFENLSKTNQLFYTTHSPFLVDADMLDRARKVFVAADGTTKASSDLRRGEENPRKSGATYAIYSALNMNVAESILYGCHPIIVEGPSDQHYLSTIKTVLIGRKKITPKREVVFPPSHGASNAKVVASILSGRDEELPYILLDGDATGKRMANDLKSGIYQVSKEKVVCTDEAAGFPDSEIEDLFPADFLADVVDRWERRPDKSFGDTFVIGRPIVPQIKAWAASHDIALEEGWKVELARAVKKRALDRSSSFNDENLDRWAALFTSLGVG